jgi:hypothetical protein
VTEKLEYVVIFVVVVPVVISYLILEHTDKIDGIDGWLLKLSQWRDRRRQRQSDRVRQRIGDAMETVSALERLQKGEKYDEAIAILDDVVEYRRRSNELDRQCRNRVPS